MEKTIHLLIMYTMLVLTVLLFHKGRKHQRSLILAIFASVEVLTNGINSLTLSGGWSFFDQFPFSHFIYKPLYCLWVPLFYFYVQSCFSTEFRWERKHLVHFLPFIFSFVFFLIIWAVKGNHYIWENLYREDSFLHISAYTVDIIVKIQYVAYNLSMIIYLLNLEKEWKLQNSTITQLAVDIRWLRFIVYGYALGCFGGIVYFISNLINREISSTINIFVVSYFFLFFFIIFYDTITHKHFYNNAKARLTLTPDNKMRLLMKEVERIVKDKEMYLEPELSLQQIAKTLNEKERNISQAINTIQKRNIKDYINSYRIEHACNLLSNNKDKPIFEIMFESGFNTKGAFNLAFKKITSRTPTEYRNKTY